MPEGGTSAFRNQATAIVRLGWVDRRLSAFPAYLPGSSHSAFGRYLASRPARLNVSDGWFPAIPVSGGEIESSDAQFDGSGQQLCSITGPPGETTQMAAWSPTAAVQMEWSVRRPRHSLVHAARHVIDGRRSILPSQRSGAGQISGPDHTRQRRGCSPRTGLTASSTDLPERRFARALMRALAPFGGLSA